MADTTPIESQVREIVTRHLGLEGGEQMIAAKVHDIESMILALTQLADPAAPAAIVHRYIEGKRAEGYIVIQRQHDQIGVVHLVCAETRATTTVLQSVYVDPQLNRPYAMRVASGVEYDAPIAEILDSEIEGTRLT